MQLKNVKKLISESKKHYDWAIIPDLYIGTSLLLCKELLTYAKFHDEVLYSNEILKKLCLRSPHANYELILPLVYNFKQGIELYIKALGIIDYGTYQKIHDLKNLFIELKKSAISTQNETIIKQLYNKTWPIIKKYYYGRYIPLRKWGNFGDKMNEAERYPEYKGKLQSGKMGTYKIPDRYKWVTKAVVEQIQKDIQTIEQKFAQAQRDIKPIKRFIYGRKRE